jgi:hypothetical protein
MALLAPDKRGLSYLDSLASIFVGTPNVITMCGSRQEVIHLGEQTTCSLDPFNKLQFKFLVMPRFELQTLESESNCATNSATLV